MFTDMLRTQLILKNIVSPEDWERISDHIQYDFIYDNQFSELKESELMNERLALAAVIEPYIGKYYSARYVRTKILRQTDGDIIEIDKQIKKEIEDGIIPDPSAIDPITGEPLPPEGVGYGTADMGQNGMDAGKIPKEDNIDKQSTVTDAQSQKDAKKAKI